MERATEGPLLMHDEEEAPGVAVLRDRNVGGVGGFQVSHVANVLFCSINKGVQTVTGLPGWIVEVVGFLPSFLASNLKIRPIAMVNVA